MYYNIMFSGVTDEHAELLLAKFDQEPVNADFCNSPSRLSHYATRLAAPPVSSVEFITKHSLSVALHTSVIGVDMGWASNGGIKWVFGTDIDNSLWHSVRMK